MAESVSEYDNRALHKSMAYFGADSRPRLHRALGFAKVSVNYYGDVAEPVYTDAEARPIPTHVVVRLVVPGSQAGRGGLDVGEVLLTYDGAKVTTMAQFFLRRRSEKPEDAPRDLTVSRKGQTRVMQIRPEQLGAMLVDEIVHD